MKEKNKVEKLLEDIETARKILDSNDAYYLEFKTKELSQYGKNKMTAIVMAKILSTFYESLETLFLKVSSFFENELSADRWHKHLLTKMNTQIKNTREKVISDKTYSILEEFLEFRHFFRYNFKLEYEWKKLEELEKKYATVRHLLKKDLNKFVGFLEKIK